MKIIITESQFVKLKLKRHLDELSKHIENAYDLLNPKAFKTFDEFLNRVIINASGQFVYEYMNEPDRNFYQNSRTIIEPIVRNLVMDKYFKDLLDYYKS